MAAQIAYATPIGSPFFRTYDSATNATAYPSTTMIDGPSFEKPSESFRETVAETSAAIASARRRYAPIG